MPDTAIAFLGVIFGFVGTIAISLLFDTGQQVNFAIGIILLLLIAAFLIWIKIKPRQIGFKNLLITLPNTKQCLLQLAVGVVDMSAAIYAAYILLPENIIQIGFSHFAVFYIGAVLLGIVSQAPGGIGVFEAAMITALAASGRADALAALLLYRVIYNLIPFCCACITVAIHELKKVNSIKGKV